MKPIEGLLQKKNDKVCISCEGLQRLLGTEMQRTGTAGSQVQVNGEMIQGG